MQAKIWVRNQGLAQVGVMEHSRQNSEFAIFLVSFSLVRGVCWLREGGMDYSPQNLEFHLCFHAFESLAWELLGSEDGTCMLL
jgi:hypothetical protein